MKDKEFYIKELENVTRWLEEHLTKLAAKKVEQLDLDEAVDTEKANLMITANESDSDGKQKYKNAELRDAMVLKTIAGNDEYKALVDVKRTILAEDATVRIADYQFKALIAIMSFLERTKNDD
jgi:hypothetical protein